MDCNCAGATCSSRYSVPCVLLATARVPQQHNSSSSAPSQPHAVNQHQCHQQPEQRIPAGCSSSRGSSSGGSWIVSPWQQHSQQPVISHSHSLPLLSTAAAARAWHLKASFCSATPSNMLPHKQQQRLISSMPDFHSTTILCVRKGPEVRPLPHNPQSLYAAICVYCKLQLPCSIGTSVRWFMCSSI